MDAPRIQAISPVPESQSPHSCCAATHKARCACAGKRAATESPESSADGFGGKGLGGFTAISSEEPGAFRGGMPKSASTPHLSGLHIGMMSQAVRAPEVCRKVARWVIQRPIATCCGESLSHSGFQALSIAKTFRLAFYAAHL